MPLRPIYDPAAVAPMWQELAAVGVEPLTSPEQVDEVLGRRFRHRPVIVNSVCGCAAGQARPGAMLALQNPSFRIAPSPSSRASTATRWSAPAST